MSKIIRMTPEYQEQIKAEFAAALASSNLLDGKLSFTKTFETVDRKANLYFTEDAWYKMQALIREFDKEVAWHGVAERGGGDDYVIRDILVYPQEVTGATVTTDQSKYQDWLYDHEDDVFNNIRMQGHSHVNMGVTPSAVDDSLYERILDQLDDDMFYIFLIYNKRGEKTIKIYDLQKNTLFETKDVTVLIIEAADGIEKFLREAKGMVTTKTYTPPASSNYPGQSSVATAVNNVTSLYGGKKDATPTPPAGQSSKKSEPKSKKKDKKKAKIGAGWSGANAQGTMSGFDDDDDDPYGQYGMYGGLYRGGHL